MSEWSVALTWRCDPAPSDDDLDATVDALTDSYAVASVFPGHLRIRLTVEEGTVNGAIMLANARAKSNMPDGLHESLQQLVAIDGAIVELLDAELAHPTYPDFVGVAEAAALMTVSRQRVSALAKQGSMPAPVATLASGPVWHAHDIRRYADNRKAR